MSETLAFLEEALAEIKRQGFVWKPRLLEGPQGARARFDGQEVVNLSSNNYLGLNNHPKTKEAAKRAVEAWGVGAGAVRPLAGTMRLHRELEEALVRFKGAEAAVVLSSGFTANLAAIQTLMGKEDVIFSEELNHGSIIDGCRLSRAQIKVWPHRDVAALRELVRREKPNYRRALIVTDGVFSMDGDIAPLRGIAEVAEEFGCISMVDDAHASGVLGRAGRGSVDHFDLHGRVDVQMGTLSKAIGSMGAYLAGSKAFVELIRQQARPWLLSTAHPPAVVAASLAAIQLLDSPEGEALVNKLWDNSDYFKQGLVELGLDTGGSQTPITPVIAGESHTAAELSKRLFERGVYAQEIVYPMVAEEKARVRTIVTAEHARADLDEALEAFRAIGKDLGLI